MNAAARVVSATPLPRSEPGLDRYAFDLLCLTMVVVLALHAPHLPLWLSLALALILAGRWAQRRVRGGRVPWLLRIPLTLALPLLIIAYFGTLFGQLPGSALVVGMLVLKLLEAERSRDARIGVAFASFALMSALLFSQGLVSTLVVAIGLVPALATLSALEPARGERESWRGQLLPVLRMLLFAVPLALAAFLFVPRLNTPLWGAPSDSPARTGVAGRMSPGDFTRLLVDDSPAFRVSFDGPRPPRMQRYFRGPVLWQFDGRDWTPGHALTPPTRDHVPEMLQNHGGNYAYRVTLQPTRRHWLFALDTPLQAPAGAYFTAARTLRTQSRINDVRSYRVRSSTQHVLALHLSRSERRRGLLLPQGFDPRAHQLARKWRGRYGDDGAAIAAAALELFHDGGFSYTLSPPPLGRDSVDDFLFSTRQGFCEHYASAFTFLMRAAGIPARVVTGYQGGYWNRLGEYLLIRQSDAHAWSEVWLQGRGWVRFDPTAAVRPERVDIGAAAAAGTSREWYQSDWLQSLRNHWDIVNRWWNQAVTGFNALRQDALLKPFGIRHADTRVLSIALAISVTLLLAAGLGMALWRKRQRDPVLAAMHTLQRRLAGVGVVRASSEGPRHYLNRAARALPHERIRLHTLLRTYLGVRYAQMHASPESIRHFTHQVREFRPRHVVK